MIENILAWFQAAVPAPTDKNRSVQIGVHLEEAGEMMLALGADYDCLVIDILAHKWKSADVGFALDEMTQDQHVALLDALCDQIVTAVGVAHMMGYDIEGALTEVNRSNYSKFVDGKPVFDANMKVAKGPSYSPPELARFAIETSRRESDASC